MARKKVTWRETSIDGMTMKWRRDGETLRIELSSRVDGWVAVGFNREPTLGGSRLFMARVQAGVAHVEEHWTRPPNHGPIDLQTATEVDGNEQDGTTASFAVTLAPGAWHTTLAWSRDDDFDHHSAVRRMVELDL